jgi:hypothetical protein
MIGSHRHAAAIGALGSVLAGSYARLTALAAALDVSSCDRA